MPDNAIITMMTEYWQQILVAAGGLLWMSRLENKVNNSEMEQKKDPFVKTSIFQMVIKSHEELDEAHLDAVDQKLEHLGKLINANEERQKERHSELIERINDVKKY